jgi:Bacterial TSP3 repeat
MKINMLMRCPLFILLMLASALVVAADEIDDTDSDGDGLTDIDEARQYKTDSQLVDTDTDGLADGLEVNQYWTLPLVADTDGDGFIDGVEVRLGTDPTEAEDRPTPETASFADLDGDGISNVEERALGSDPQRVDSDFDGLSDFQEIRQYLTSPILIDSDGDNARDGEEVEAGTDPMDAQSHPPAAK